jgi:anti-anti-sigma factor
LTGDERSIEPPDQPDGLAMRAAGAGNRTELALSGELDLSQAGALKQQLGHALDSLSSGGDTPTSLVLDLQNLTFIDSSGIQVLVAAKRRCLEHGVELSLRLGDSQVRRMLSLAGVAQFLGVE